MQQSEVWLKGRLFTEFVLHGVGLFHFPKDTSLKNNVMIPSGFRVTLTEDSMRTLLIRTKKKI